MGTFAKTKWGSGPVKIEDGAQFNRRSCAKAFNIRLCVFSGDVNFKMLLMLYIFNRNDARTQSQ